MLQFSAFFACFNDFSLLNFNKNFRRKCYTQLLFLLNFWEGLPVLMSGLLELTRLKTVLPKHWTQCWGRGTTDLNPQKTSLVRKEIQLSPTGYPSNGRLCSPWLQGQVLVYWGCENNCGSHPRTLSNTCAHLCFILSSQHEHLFNSTFKAMKGVIDNRPNRKELPDVDQSETKNSGGRIRVIEASSYLMQ